MSKEDFLVAILLAFAFFGGFLLSTLIARL